MIFLHYGKQCFEVQANPHLTAKFGVLYISSGPNSEMFSEFQLRLLEIIIILVSHY
jgi:hypothetical protein